MSGMGRPKSGGGLDAVLIMLLIFILLIIAIAEGPRP